MIAEFLSVFDSHHRGTFIGESGGGYTGIPLGARLESSFPTLEWCSIFRHDGYLAVSGNHDAARGVIPDFLVKHTIEDLIAGLDKDFELALELAQKRR